ncbi:uncharacterized protein Z520_00406 [Fonsecaea multimorphosa CBS 102226]|uniref:Uncharacterized protein n=1 Tax=Fonsecaea multimorphosa CBS 102226 TaxID=1442371 RepID=A0A0D2KJR1_9EURO|nr:uncharacterized protein Z520_00406 [Fonsecaea multimorphosa CBS 102226]KIY03715.1 hypothetical protein Z520_00406 [Fonsecaea multimorphosa CBS 102226]OAL32414.1 hypothetical protein AYO22_00436 [Fonsecaea multimorphosa]
MYHFQNKPKERAMSVEDRENHAATHHNTTEANLNNESMKVAKEIAARRASNEVEMNREGHPNLKFDVDPLEPDHSLPPSQRTLYAKQDREAKGEVPSHVADASTATRNGSIVEKVQRFG